jgi:hypothetical protein
VQSVVASKKIRHDLQTRGKRKGREVRGTSCWQHDTVLALCSAGQLAKAC